MTAETASGVTIVTATAIEGLTKIRGMDFVEIENGADCGTASGARPRRVMTGWVVAVELKWNPVGLEADVGRVIAYLNGWTRRSTKTI